MRCTIGEVRDPAGDAWDLGVVGIESCAKKNGDAYL